MRGLGGPRRSLGFLLGALGSQGRVPSRGEEQVSNVTGPLWLPCSREFGDWKLVTRETLGLGPGAMEWLVHNSGSINI